MREGRATTEHARALRAELACSLLGCGGLALCWRGGAWVIGSALLALAIVAYAALAALYAHSRTLLKGQEARAAADIKTAEAMAPKQRVI